MNGTDLQGTVAESGNGSIGIVQGQRKSTTGNILWVGISFNGRPWASRNPKVLSYSLHQYISDSIEQELEKEKDSYIGALGSLKNQIDFAHKPIIDKASFAIERRAASRKRLRQNMPKTKHDKELATA